MAHFNLESELNRVLTLDGSITNGPKARWEKKASEKSANSTLNKTPLKGSSNQLNKSSSSKTPNATPKRTEKAKTTSGKKKTPKTTPNGGDRFIPNRSTTQFELGYYKIHKEKENDDDDDMTPTRKEYQRVMSENLNGFDVNGQKIIHYNANKPPLAPTGYLNSLRVVYSQTKNPASLRKTVRHVPSMPERILDAPDILDDYYLNLLDWSINNHVALCLNNTVYLWNASSGETQQLVTLSESEYVSSVSWLREGTHLAVGTSAGEVQLWDISNQRLTRAMRGHDTRVGALSWNSYVISSGSRAGNIHHHDVRVAEHCIGRSENHSQEVCGLRWSPDGRYLASGGNDNLLNIWPKHSSGIYADVNPLFTFTLHQAAVKALNWCPWQNGILASGGGTSDRCIRFWNANTGLCLNTIDTKSQVCGILWSREYKEVISGHGYANNQLIIWKYPTMQQVAELTGHSSRILYMALSPDGSCVASAAADETLRLWHCFPIDAAKKVAAKSTKLPNSIFRQSIR